MFVHPFIRPKEVPISNSSEIELAWAAGFFDGEGHSRWNTNIDAVDGRRAYGTFAAIVAQVEREPLDRFMAAVGGLGKVYGPYKHKPKSGSTKENAFYQYVVTGKKGIDAFMKIRPYLTSIKQTQGDAGIKRYMENAAIPKKWRNGAMKKRDLERAAAERDGLVLF